jgi:hypothetical protein
MGRQTFISARSSFPPAQPTTQRCADLRGPLASRLLARANTPPATSTWDRTASVCAVGLLH